MSGMRERYQSLLDAWKRAEGVMKEERPGMTHPAYRQILGLGRDGVAFLAEDMRNGVDMPPAVHALFVRHIGFDPVTPSITESGDRKAIVGQLVKWAERNGRIRRADPPADPT